VIEFIQNNGVVPCLAAVLVGDDPASEVYVRNKRRACEGVGIDSQLHRLDASAPTEELLTLVAKLNKDQTVHGILVQLPLPRQIDANRVLVAINPAKDVDAFHPENVGRLVQGRSRFLPCTPQGVQQLLVRSGIEIAGRHVVILGRSDIVGRPLSIMLSQRGPGGDATVTLCHSRTPDLAAVTTTADILIVAIGRAKFVTADMVRPGAVVVDVGINRSASGVVGDVDFAAVRFSPHRLNSCEFSYTEHHSGSFAFGSRNVILMVGGRTGGSAVHAKTVRRSQVWRSRYDE
jgi:methylenetetrahydrofolate dehydrogenase (NADP+)/methenyltetrahydrofolate cyclohydrolase